MCVGSSRPRMPDPPPPPPPPAPTPTVDDAEVVKSRDRERRRIALAQGMRSTILTGALGDTTQAPTGQKTLLGA